MRASICFVFIVGGAVLLAAACDGALTVDGGNANPGALWSGNGPDCPAQLPLEETACPSEALICAYYDVNQDTAEHWYKAFACREASSTALRWHLYDGMGSYSSCPQTEPASGADCFGYGGAVCKYPLLNECNCNADDLTWSCVDLLREPPDPPSSSIPLSKAVGELTPEERHAWCEWFLVATNGEGVSPPPETPLTADGYANNSTVLYGDEFFCSGCVPVLPVSYCVGNLALSSCSAPLSELTDCVVTIRDNCWPYHHGCARYLEKSGCLGTIVGDADNGLGGNGDCATKVQ